MDISKPRLRREEASQYLRERHGIGLSTKTLANRALVGSGPPFQMVGRYPLYPVAELEAWAQAQIGTVVTSTTQAQAAQAQAAAA